MFDLIELIECEKASKSNNVAECSKIVATSKTSCKPVNMGSVAVVAVVAEPLTDFSFLNETPFNEAMLNKGLEMWAEPFDQDDINELMAGTLTVPQAREYLFLWARQNKERYQKLRCIPLEKKPKEVSVFDITEELATYGIDSPFEDRDFITKQIEACSINQKKEILKQYAEVWLKATTTELVNHKKANIGRKAGNCWLREKVKQDDTL